MIYMLLFYIICKAQLTLLSVQSLLSNRMSVCLYRDSKNEPKERKKGSASIWYIYASLLLW